MGEPEPLHNARPLRIGIAIFAFVILFWLGFVPERRDRVFRAMPENSVFVSEHLDLPRVWRNRFDNPLLVQTLAGAGVHRVEDWASDTNIVWIVRLVSGRRSLIGWSPSLGPSATPCWTGASWAGFRGPLLRAMLFVRWVPGLGRLQTTARGTRYLDTASKKEKARGETGLKLGFYLRENILLATLGDDPDAVRALDWRLTRDAPLAPVFANDPAPWLKTGSAPHRAWVSPAASPITLPFLSQPVEARIDTFENDRIGLDLTVPFDARPANRDRPTLANRCTAADALASDAAAALLLLPASTVRAAVQDRIPALALFRAPPPPDEDAALYLTTQPLGGRVFGLAVPAATLLYPGPNDTPGVLTQSVAHVARATKLKLRTYEPDYNLNRRLLIDWMGGSRHLRLAREDCVAVEQHPGWLTLCTSAASLDAQRRTRAEAPAAWRKALTERHQAAGATGLNGFLWIDIAPTADELRQIYAVYRLATSLGAIRVTDDEADAMRGIQRVLDALRFRGALAVGWAQHDAGMRVSLAIHAR